MVEYCCVYACGRNSRDNEHLTYYSLPKGRERRELWLLAAGRDDLLENDQSSSIRFCSVHFPPAQVGKNLIPDAIPSLYLPGSLTYDDHDFEAEEHNVICNNCSDGIIGFRYRCIVCPDFDLCQKCEMLEVHSKHLMIRISKPNKFKQADDMIAKWRGQLIAEDASDDNMTSGNDNGHQLPDCEPITKLGSTHNTIICKEDDRLTKTVKKRNTQQDASTKRLEERKNKKRLKMKEFNNIEERTNDQHLNLRVPALPSHVSNVKLNKIIKSETIVPSGDLLNPDSNLQGQEFVFDNVVDIKPENIIIKCEPCDVQNPDPPD